MIETPAGNGISRRSLLLSGAAVGAATVASPLHAAVKHAGLNQRPGPVHVQVPMRIYGNDAYPVWHRRPLPPETPVARYPGFAPGTKLLRKGTIRREGAMVLPCDIVFERDVPLKLRDGTRILTDIFRPAKPGRYPAVFGFSPYGKEYGGQWFDDVPGRSGVPLANVSELQRFEGPDPAFWCNQGYVVLSPDARGANESGGNINFWGRQVAEDGFDFIEWAAKQPWSDGKIAMTGNSWLAMSQWWIAAERPPHLAAIAPWEGAADHYVKGGVVDTIFADQIIQTFAGRQLVEDLPFMLASQALKTPYWEDKSARLERIEAPAYIVASYTHPAHTLGSFAGFRRIASKQRWLRVHNTNEWQDYNTPEHQADLLRFFDHVMKGKANGWNETPRIRLAVLDPGGTDTLGRVEREWPLARQKPAPLFLTGTTLASAPAATATSLRYPAQGGSATFRHVFDRDTEITGYMKLKLWVEAAGADDMDMMVRVEKRGADGRPFPPPPGAPMGMPIASTGALRVSLRALDLKSTPLEPVMLRERIEKLRSGEIVPVEIAIWPMAMHYHAGEQLVLTIAGSRPFPPFKWGFGEARIPVPADGGTFRPGEKVPMKILGGNLADRPAFVAAQAVPPLPDRNRGEHVLHFGGEYDSHLLLPFIPA